MVECRFRMTTVIELMFTLLQTFAVAGERAHAGCDHLLALVTANRVKGFRHQVVEGAGDLVHHHGGECGPVQQLFGLELVDHGDAGHHAGAVGDGEALTDVDFERFEAVLAKHFRCGTPFALVVNTPLPNHRQGQVR